MAVKDDEAYHPTEGLVLSHPRPHYRTSVIPTHWQLRSLIGSEKNNYVYFPSGTSNTHLKRLNTVTSECETIKLLSFEPRCLVARNGWMCCGGEHGDFTAIQLDPPIDSTEPNDASSFVDPILRFQLSPSEIDSSQTDGISLRPRPRQPRLAQSKTFGKERVNCITMWFPPTLVQRFDGAYHEPVAVLSNNDKNVTIVSLRNEEALDEIAFPDCVNRAVMSPDGKLLVAVCDDPYLYVYQRIRTSSGESRRSTTDYQWKEVKKVHLKGQKLGDRSDNRGSFAACFSSTGRLLAIGTQYGRISIFNAATLPEPGMDSFITTFKSSRSDMEIGAVRDMAFAPGPIDLLAWSEDRGHIGVADLRNGFTSRQILCLENQDDYEHVDTITKSPSGTSNSFIDPRLLDSTSTTNGHDALSSTFASTLDLSLDATRTHTRDLLERYSNQLSNSTSPLTPEETRVLEALQEHRRRREQRAAERAAARGSGSTSTAARLPWIERGIRSSSGADSVRTADRNQPSPRFVTDLLGSVREQMREAEDRQATSSRNVRDILGTVRDQLRTTEERLQGLQASIRESRETTRDLPETEQSPSRRPPISRLLAANATPPPATTSGGWADLDALYNLSIDNTTPALRHLRDSALVDAETRLRRERMNRLMRDYQLAHPSSRYPSMLRERSDPHDTAGLSWSEDGRTLFVGAVNGIYEFKVNMIRRRTFPSITCR